LYEVVDFWWRLLEDKGPEVRNLCDDVGTLLVEREVKLLGFADYPLSVLLIDVFMATVQSP
jgi:hypothetical protein